MIDRTATVRVTAMVALAGASVLAWPPVAAAQAQEAAHAPDVQVVLERARAVYDGLTSMQAEFDQTIEIPLLGRRRDGSGAWYQKGRGRFKMNFTDPEGDVIVADGSHLWLYYPSTHPGQVIRSAIEANITGAGMVDLQGRIFEEASTGYEAALDGAAEVTGHATWLVTLIPTAESPYRQVRVWVDQESFLVRRFEILEENETVRTIVLRELRPDAEIPDAVFEFVPPEGTDVFEG